MGRLKNSRKLLTLETKYSAKPCIIWLQGPFALSGRSRLKFQPSYVAQFPRTFFPQICVHLTELEPTAFGSSDDIENCSQLSMQHVQGGTREHLYNTYNPKLIMLDNRYIIDCKQIFSTYIDQACTLIIWPSRAFPAVLKYTFKVFLDQDSFKLCLIFYRMIHNMPAVIIIFT